MAFAGSCLTCLRYAPWGISQQSNTGTSIRYTMVQTLALMTASLLGTYGHRQQRHEMSYSTFSTATTGLSSWAVQTRPG